MKKLLLAGVAVLLLSTGTAHAREWQGNMPKPIGKLPSYPPVKSSKLPRPVSGIPIFCVKAH
jgi:hypothetical protein